MSHPNQYSKPKSKSKSKSASHRLSNGGNPLPEPISTPVSVERYNRKVAELDNRDMSLSHTLGNVFDPVFSTLFDVRHQYVYFNRSSDIQLRPAANYKLMQMLLNPIAYEVGMYNSCARESYYSIARTLLRCGRSIEPNDAMRIINCEKCDPRATEFEETAFCSQNKREFLVKWARTLCSNCMVSIYKIENNREIVSELQNRMSKQMNIGSHNNVVISDKHDFQMSIDKKNHMNFIRSLNDYLERNCITNWNRIKSQFHKYLSAMVDLA